MSLIGGACSALLSAGIFLADQKLKSKSEDHELPSQGKQSARQPYFSNYHNHGAALNLGEKNPVIVATLALSMTVFCTILFLFSLGKKGSGLLRAGFAMLLGGAYSNLYDRLKREYVVDYIALHLPGGGVRASGGNRIQELVLNVADIAVAIGAMLLALNSARNDK